MESRLSLCAALVTPVDGDGEINAGAFASHARWVLRHGCDGVVAFGTTGESASFSTDARTAGLAALVEEGVPAAAVIVGTGCCSVAETVRLSRHALELGCHGVLIHPPFFFRSAAESGLHDFYARVIDGIGDSTARLYLYHFPEMTGLAVTHSLVERLCDAFAPLIAGIKDSSGSLDSMTAFARAFPALDVYAGDDHLLWPHLAAGGAGAITATANLTPNLLRAVAEGWREESADARDAHDALVGLWEETLLRFPISEALKEIIAERAGDPGWRALCTPLEPLPAARRQQLLSLAQPYLKSIPPGLGAAEC